MARDALMQAGFVQHNCSTLNRTILVPINMDRYNSKLITQAKCVVCGKDEFERQVDQTVAPSKGFYMTV